MIGLEALWVVSLILSGAALLIMLGLILGRLVYARRSRARDEETRRLLPLLLGDTPPGDLRPQGRTLDHLTDLSVDLIQLVKGKEKLKLVANASRLGVHEQLLLRVANGRVRKRTSAAEALQEFDLPESVDALHAALSDQSAEVRLAAALSLAAIGQAPPATMLVEMLQIGTAEKSMLAIDLLERISRTRPAEVSELIRRPETPAAVKAAAIDALSGSGDYSLVPVICELALAAGEEDVELTRYLKALGRFAHPAGGRAVMHWLHSQNWWVRAAAAEAAGKIGIISAARRLAHMLDDSDWWVRFRASEALIQLGPAGLLLLREASHLGPVRSRRAATLTLAENGLKL